MKKMMKPKQQMNSVASPQTVAAAKQSANAGALPQSQPMAGKTVPTPPIVKVASNATQAAQKMAGPKKNVTLTVAVQPKPDEGFINDDHSGPEHNSSHR